MLSFSRGPATKRPQLNSTGWSWPRLIDIQENHTLASSKAGPSTAAPSRRDSVIEEEKSASQISLPASVASHEQSSTQSSEDSAPPENLKDIAMGERLAVASPDQATNSVPVVDTPPRTSEGTLVPEEQKEPASISNEGIRTRNQHSLY